MCNVYVVHEELLCLIFVTAVHLGYITADTASHCKFLQCHRPARSLRRKLHRFDRINVRNVTEAST